VANKARDKELVYFFFIEDRRLELKNSFLRYQIPVERYSNSFDRNPTTFSDL